MMSIVMEYLSFTSLQADFLSWLNRKQLLPGIWCWFSQYAIKSKTTGPFSCWHCGERWKWDRERKTNLLRQWEMQAENLYLSTLLLLYKPGNEERAVFILTITISLLISPLCLYRLWHEGGFICVCVCMSVTFWENGVKVERCSRWHHLLLSHTSPPHYLSAGTLSPSTPPLLHFVWIPYFVFQWTFIALLNLNPTSLLLHCILCSPLWLLVYFTYL